MWIYRRIYSSVVACCLLLGCLFLLRLRLSDRIFSRSPAPEFIPDVPRFRTSRVCSQRALVLVNSSPVHDRRRQVIRETWAHPTLTQSLDISVAFGVGTADTGDVQRSLDWEAEIYGDLFQGPTLDSETKSGSRIMQFLKAARSACSPMPKFIMKVEDDVFVNIDNLGMFLEILEMYSSSNTMWCLDWNRRLDRMGNNDTWVVPLTDSIQAGHPKYCVGVVYLMTGKALDAIIRRDNAKRRKNMLPEDVYVTGILTKEAGTTLSLLGDRFLFDDRLEKVDPDKVVFAYLGDDLEAETVKLWNVLVREKLNDSRRSDLGL